MTDYEPSLVKEHEVRSAFTPPLEYYDISKVELLLKIESVEDYIKAVYFDGAMPSRNEGKVPALLLAIAKVVKGNPKLTKEHGEIESLDLGDYSVDYSLEDGAYEIAKSWEQMAHEMLEMRGENNWQLRLVND